MKLLFIGGTGLISSACVDLAAQRGHEVFLLNRGLSQKYPPPAGAVVLRADMSAPYQPLASMFARRHFDAVIDFISFTPENVRRSMALFRDKTAQFVFISSASAYQKPPKRYLVTEETPLENPFWMYAQDKIACEEILMEEYRRAGFPVTIVRPSLTYGPSQIPIIGASWMRPYTIVERIKRGKKVVIPGDGTSLWTLTWNADFAVGLLGLLGRREAIGQAFHITSDEVLSWNQIFIELYSALGAPINVLHIASDFIILHNPELQGTLLGDKIHSVVFDNSKIKRFVPEFECKVTWAEGVRRALAWFEEHPQFQTIDEETNLFWDKMIAEYESALPR